MKRVSRLLLQVTATVRKYSFSSHAVQKTSPFASEAGVIGTPVNTADNTDTISVAKALEDEYKQMLATIMAGGGPKAVERHVTRNRKVLARDRLKMLIDKNSEFFEVSPLAGLKMEYGDVPAAGVVAGVGRVCGQYCMVVANDATVKGGTMYPIAVKKQVRAQQIAQQNRLPCIYVVDSGGGFLPLQADLFPDKEDGGRVFYNEAVLGAMNIPQISIVCGSCTAGGAYVPTMAEEAIIVHRIGTIFLGGPPLVQAATGEIINSEDLGGATLHSKISGCTDYFAETEEVGFNQVRATIASLNRETYNVSCDYKEPLYAASDLSSMVNPNTVNVYEVLARLVDGSKVHEFKELYGPNLVTVYAEIQGQLVGMVANNGPLTKEAAEKGSHFTQLCSSRNIPMIFLQNTSTQGTDSIEKFTAEDLKAQGKMVASVSCADIPKITIIIGTSYGPTNFAMAGRSIDPNFLFMWPSAKVSIDHPQVLKETMQNVCDCNVEEVDNYIKTVNIKSSAFYSSTRMWDDGIILPQDTRKVLGQCLKIVTVYKHYKQEHSIAPMLRM